MLRRARTSLALVGLVALLVALFALLAGPHAHASIAAPLAPSIANLHLPLAAPSASSLPTAPSSPAPAPVAAEPAEPADAHLDRSWRAPLAGGLLMFPPSFHSDDGRYDLVLHLNGNTDLVEESFGYAGLNAVVVVLNLGVGSGVYEDRFADPSAFTLILSRVQDVMVNRGLKNAHLGRVGLSGWSSGYGGIIKILQHEEHFEKIDAILLFDSIHCGFNPFTKVRKADQFEPTLRFARKAVEGKALLSITHSEIETYGYYNARKTTDMLLQELGVPRVPASVPQPMPKLVSMFHVVPDAYMKSLPPLSEAHRGELHIRGYVGNGPITHMLHLVQMSTTALPDLVRYWGRAC